MDGKSKINQQRVEMMPIEDTTLQVQLKENKLFYMSLRIPLDQARQILNHSGLETKELEQGERPKIWTVFDPYRGVFMAFLHKEDADRAYVSLIKTSTPQEFSPRVASENLEDRIGKLERRIESLLESKKKNE